MDAKYLYTKQGILSRRKQIEHTVYIAQIITYAMCLSFTSSGKNRPTKNFPCIFQKSLILIFVTISLSTRCLNMERSYKRQGHATLKHFVGFFVQWWKAEITVA